MTINAVYYHLMGGLAIFRWEIRVRFLELGGPEGHQKLHIRCGKVGGSPLRQFGASIQGFRRSWVAKALP